MLSLIHPYSTNFFILTLLIVAGMIVGAFLLLAAALLLPAFSADSVKYNPLTGRETNYTEEVEEASK